MWMSPRRATAIATFLLAIAPAKAPASAQELTPTYEVQPPAGAAYVRAVDLSRSGAMIGLGAGSAVAAAAGEPATIYRIVKGDEALPLALAGKPVSGRVTPPAGAFSTIVIGTDGAALLISDTPAAADDLKAQLRFYNLVPGCTGAVAVQDAPPLFEGIAANTTTQRAIGSTEGPLIATCGDASSGPVKLPQLKPGDHYSLFLMPGPAGVELKGQRDETEPYRTAN